VFVDRDTFMRRVADGGFIEWTEFPGTGHLYGTPTLDDPPGGTAGEGQLPAGKGQLPAGKGQPPAGKGRPPAGKTQSPEDEQSSSSTSETVLLEIDLDGARQIKERYPDALLVLIAVPSPAVQADRLRARGDDEASVGRRVAIGEQEMKLGLRMADHVVVNDEVERSAQEVAGIIDARLSRL
jgi:guanylate kinase